MDQHTTFTPTQEYSQEQYQQHQQRNQRTQERMSKPPAYITTKDLSYLQDALSWELLAMKKCRHFANECRNNQIKQHINQAGQMHQKHYKILLKHINPANSNYHHNRGFNNG